MENKYNKGQAVITVVVFFLMITLVITASSVMTSLRDAAAARRLVDSKKVLFLSEAGAEDVVYRMKNAMNYSMLEELSMDGLTASTEVTSLSGNDKQVISTANVQGNVRKSKIVLTTDIGASFFYGLQNGKGAFIMENSSSVVGNVYSNGPVSGSNNYVRGTIVSAGPSGLIAGIHATGTAYAHTIQNSTIDEDAYYQHIDAGTTIGGTPYPGSEDKPFADMPIADGTLAMWEDALAETEISGCFEGKLSIDSSRTIGPGKIPCDLEMLNGEVTLAGPVWVEGNIWLKGASVKIDPSLGNNSVALIADNRANRSTGSKIILETSTSFVGSGDPLSYVLLVSMNNSAELGGAEIAINIGNSMEGKVFVYVPHGYALLQQNIEIKELVAYKTKMRNLSTVRYDTGLASLLFDSGPGGTFVISTWEEEE